MRVATWNINGLRSRQALLVHWLAARKPDVVALQELKLTDAQFPRAELEAQGYHAVVHGEKGWNGVAILARKPLESVQIGLPGTDFGARFASARVEGLTVASVYCPNGKSVGHADFPRKLAWYDALAAHWAASHPPDEPALLCGDFNVCPGALDSWNEAGLRGRDLPQRGRARALPRAARRGPVRRVPRAPSRRAGVHVVGLPRRRVPQARGAADRLPARDAPGARARARGRDRPRVPQEAGRPHRIRSRAGVRGSSVSRSPRSR